MTRNLVGFARTHSNPAAHDLNAEVLIEDHYIETYVMTRNLVGFACAR